LRPYPVNIQLKKRAGRVAQVVEHHLFSTCEAPSSNPSTAPPQKKEKKNQKKIYTHQFNNITYMLLHKLFLKSHYHILTSCQHLQQH
jgi:hypothetical protein